jgi:hypothetical protein
MTKITRKFLVIALLAASALIVAGCDTLLEAASKAITEGTECTIKVTNSSGVKVTYVTVTSGIAPETAADRSRDKDLAPGDTWVCQIPASDPDKNGWVVRLFVGGTTTDYRNKKPGAEVLAPSPRIDIEKGEVVIAEYTGGSNWKISKQ